MTRQSYKLGWIKKGGWWKETVHLFPFFSLPFVNCVSYKQECTEF